MKIADFAAESDLVGRRILVRWQFLLEEGETLAAIPGVRLRRKLRDFEFNPPAPADPTVAYDSGAFPPPGALLSEIPGWESRDGELRQHTTAESVARPIQGQMVEVRRRTTTTVFDLNNRPVSQKIEFLDTGEFPGGLVPGQTYYYEVQSPAIPPGGDPAPYRATATATDSFNLARTLYELLPDIYRRHDVRIRPATPGGEFIPEAAQRGGQLRRLVDLFGVALDNLRGSAEALRALHDMDRVDYRYLPMLARWIGWDLNFDTTIPVQRNEIKSAPALYRGLGSLPNLRAIVDYYTGWYSQIAEFAQSISRSNQPARLNLYALAQTADGWRSPDDAALALGFTGASAAAVGAPGSPATLTGAAEPFPLATGMKLTVAVDAGLPTVVQFGSGDFADIAHASAAEVALVLNRLLTDVEVLALADGRVSLRTYRRGAGASLEIRPESPALVSLEGAPGGRLATGLDAHGRLRLFYETTDPGDSPAAAPRRHLRYKTWRQGTWGDSIPLEPAPAMDHGSPAAVSLPGGNVLLAWIENPGSASARILTAVGTPRPPRPAALAGQRGEPFAIAPGNTLALRRDHVGLQTLTFLAGDFATPGAATAAEVALAISARLAGVQASVQSNRSLLIASTAPVPERLEIDLRLSDAAREIGFGPRNAVATGSWDESLSWAPAEAVPPVPAGRHADLGALADGTGDVLLFWSQHDGVYWRIMTARRQGNLWSPPEALTGADTHNREPAPVLADDGRIWLFWSQSLNGPPGEDRRLLLRRIFDPAAGTWDLAAPVTTFPAAGPAADRQPAAVLPGNGQVRVFFVSDRSGSRDLWSVNVGLADGVAGAPEPVTATADAESAPMPVRFQDGRLWLLFRSDRSLPLSRESSRLEAETASVSAEVSRAPGGLPDGVPSSRLSDTGTLRHFHGSLAASPGDARRNSRMRRWDDLSTYTPQLTAAGARAGALVGEALYTPNTFGIYISRIGPAAPLTQRRIERLRQVLERAIPFNMRALIVLTPPVTVEYVFEAGTVSDLQEAYRDEYPLAEYYAGLTDGSIANLPNWIFFLSNTPGHVAADPGDLASLRRRSFFPPFT